MRTRPVFSAILAAGGAAALITAPSIASGRAVNAAVPSSNWAGYSASGTTFSKVSGSWVEPATDCTDTTDGQSSFWVGLGGAEQGSGALEQTGTEADCDGTHYAWYEMVPQAPVRLPLAIHAGDHISASVTVNGHNVTLSLRDATTGRSATKNVSSDAIDTSSAEWIAEAPSQCSSDLSECDPVSLANFGTVKFSGASATAGGHTGPITDGKWTAEPMALNASDGWSPGAVPSTLTRGGSAFSVTAQDSDAQPSDGAQPDPAAADPYGDSGYGPGGGWGGSGYADGTGGGWDGGGSAWGDGDGYGYGYGSGYGYDPGYGYSWYGD